MDTTTVLFPTLPPSSDTNQTRTIISTYVNHVLKQPLDHLSTIDSANFYAAIYNYYIFPHRDSIHDPDRAQPPWPPGGFLLHSLLQEALEAHVRSFMTNADTLKDNELLRYYVQEWNRYTTSLKQLGKSFAYWDKHWVKKYKHTTSRKRSVKELYTSNEMGYATWGRIFVNHIQEDKQKLTKALLRLVALDRNDEPIEYDLLSNVLQSLVSTGPKPNDRHIEWPKVYESCFEEPYVQSTEKYYKETQETFLKESNIFEYLREAEIWLQEEETRIGRYACERTKSGLVEKCRHILIYRFGDLIRERFLALSEPGEDKENPEMETSIELGSKPKKSDMDDVEKYFMEALLSRIPGCDKFMVRPQISDVEKHVL